MWVVGFHVANHFLHGYAGCGALIGAIRGALVRALLHIYAALLHIYAALLHIYAALLGALLRVAVVRGALISVALVRVLQRCSS